MKTKILAANRESTFLQTMKAIPITNIHSQRITKNLPNNFRSLVRIQPMYKDSVNSTHRFTFHLPKDDFVNNLMLKVTRSGSQGFGDFAFEGSLMFSEILLKQGQKVLGRNDGPYIISRIMEEEETVRNNYINLLNGNYDGTNTTYYIPLYFTHFDLEENNLLMDYVRDLSIECLRTRLENFDSVELLCYTRTYEKEYYSRYIENVFNNQPLSVFGYDVHNIKTRLTETDTSKRIDISGNFNCFAIHNHISAGNSQSINRITLQCDGITSIDIYRQENILINKNTAAVNNVVFSYYFGDKSRSYYSGGINLAIGKWYLTIYFNLANVTDSVVMLNTMIEYYTISEIGTDGIIERNNLS